MLLPLSGGLRTTTFVCINGGGGGVRASAQTASDGIGMVNDERAVSGGVRVKGVAVRLPCASP